jgi:hypothetical protein
MAERGRREGTGAAVRTSQGRDGRPRAWGQFSKEPVGYGLLPGWKP